MTREEKEQWDIFMQIWVIPALKNTWNEKKCKEIVEALEEWQEQEPDLDVVRAEINGMSGDIETIADVLQIIDKYSIERSDKE